ncbi:hypothetical protein ACTOV4_24275 [Brucella sp. C7-11G]
MSRRFIGKTAAIVSSVSARRSTAETGADGTGKLLDWPESGFLRRGFGPDIR